MADTSPPSARPVRCPISHPLGNLAGFILAITAILAFLASYTVDWGVGWMVWVPAAIALIPASALMRRRVLWWRDGTFDLEGGWLMRRARSFPADHLSIELVPTAGLWAVVVHRGTAAWPIATWVTRRRAQRVVDTLNLAAPEGAWPCQEAALPEGDR